MEIFESEYTDDLDIKDAIRLGLRALYQVSDTTFDVSTIEVGLVALVDRQFKKLEEDELSGYVDEIVEEFKEIEPKDEGDGGENSE